MPITDPIFLTTFQGSTIQRDGVIYVWVNGKYEVSSPLITDSNSSIQIPKKVILKFSGIVEPDLLLTGAEIQVYVDGQLWTGNYVKVNATNIEITLDEPFIVTQRLITFSTTKGTPKVRYVIKSRVNNQNDVVIAKIGIAEEIPVLGTANIAVITNPPILETTIGPTATSGTSGVVSQPSIGVSINYEYDTVQLGAESDYAGNFFNQNNQAIDATIGEVVGPTYE